MLVRGVQRVSGIYQDAAVQLLIKLLRQLLRQRLQYFFNRSMEIMLSSFRLYYTISGAVSASTHFILHMS